MKNRLIELLKQSEFYGEYECKDCKNTELCNKCSLHLDMSALADYLLANGVIVPPCKVGDKVYCIEYNLKIIEEYTVSGYTIKNGKLALFVFRGIYSAVVSEWFLTKEEAEAELRKRSDDNG